MIARTRREPDPFLDWKLRIFFAGGVLLAAGAILGYRVLVLLAIAILVVGLFATTILGKRRARAAEEGQGTWEEEPEEADTTERRSGS